MAEEFISVTFPLPPNLANGRLHYMVKHRRWKRYLQGAFYELHNRRLCGRPNEPTYPALEVLPVFYVHNVMDHDNATARLKWPIDALVRCHVVPDDDPKHLTLRPEEQVIDRKAPRVELRLFPCKGGEVDDADLRRGQ